MDQLKKILVGLQKYHFWALGAVVLVLLMVFWSTATAKLSQDFDGRKGAVSSHFSNMQNLAGSVDPPNEAVYNALLAAHLGLRRNVMRGWKYLYDEQTKNNPLPGVLGEDFREKWQSLGPSGELPYHLIDRYWNFIQRYFPKLLERVDVRRPKDPERLAAPGGPGGPGGPGLPGARGMPGIEGGMAGAEQIEYVGKVVWDKTNYDQLLNRFVWSKRPTTRQIRLAQEDLWVYETLLNIIKDLNKDSTSHYNASVKRIRAVDIGPYATRAFYEARNSLGLAALAAAGGATAEPGAMPGASPLAQPGLRPGPPPPASVPGAMPPAMMEGPGMMMPGMEGPGLMAPGAAAGPAGADDALYMNRYVDQNEQPVPLENGQPKHPYSEFRMMPIRMSLLMDQRKIPELMVRCANSNMPVEIRQVRLSPGRTAKVNYAAAAASPLAGMMGPMAPGVEGAGLFMPGAEGIGPGGPGGMGDMFGEAAPGMGAGETAFRGPYDFPVEILGIIYIYEPPDETKLGTGTASTGEAAQPATPEGATPAVPPDAGPAPAVPPGPAPAVPPGPAAPAPGTPAPGPGAAPAAPAANG